MGKTPAGRRRHHEHSDASESETPYSSDGHISEADEALLDAAIAQNNQAALLATQRALRMKLKEAMCTTSSAASAASTDFDASSIADADAFQLLQGDLGQVERFLDQVREEFRQELLSEADLYLRLYDHLPKELIFQRELLAGRI
jgi:hypothetical protein